MKSMFLCLLALPFTSQGNLEIQRLIDSAKADASSGKAEQAAASLVTACDMIRNLEHKKVRNEFRRLAEPLLKKIDKNHSSALSAKRSAARKLISLAKKYHKIDWDRTARALANQADLLDPGCAVKLLKSLPDSSRKIESDAATLFKGAKPADDKHKWTQEAVGIKSPRSKADDPSLLIFDQAPVSNWTLSSRVKLSRSNSHFGFLFAYRDKDHHYLLDLESDGKDLIVRLDKVDGDEVLERYCMSCPIQGKWRTKGLPILLQLQGNNIRFTVGDIHPRVLDVGIEGTMGKLGLSSGSSIPLAFDDLLLIEH